MDECESFRVSVSDGSSKVGLSVYESFRMSVCGESFRVYLGMCESFTVGCFIDVSK